MTAQLSFDGTFSSDAVASAAHSLVQQLHDEAMATIAGLAETWDQPTTDVAPAEDDEPVTYTDPASWSVADDEDEQPGADDDVLVLPVLELPSLLPRPRPATVDVTSVVEPQTAGTMTAAGAAAATDEFAVPAERQLAAS